MPNQAEVDIYIAMTAGCETAADITAYAFGIDKLRITDINRHDLQDLIRYNTFRARLSQTVHILRRLEREGYVYHADDNGTTVWRWKR